MVGGFGNVVEENGEDEGGQNFDHRMGDVQRKTMVWCMRRFVPWVSGCFGIETEQNPDGCTAQSRSQNLGLEPDATVTPDQGQGNMHQGPAAPLEETRLPEIITQPGILRTELHQRLAASSSHSSTVDRLHIMAELVLGLTAIGAGQLGGGFSLQPDRVDFTYTPGRIFGQPNGLDRMEIQVHYSLLVSSLLPAFRTRSLHLHLPSAQQPDLPTYRATTSNITGTLILTASAPLKSFISMRALLYKKPVGSKFQEYPMDDTAVQIWANTEKGNVFKPQTLEVPFKIKCPQGGLDLAKFDYGVRVSSWMMRRIWTIHWLFICLIVVSIYRQLLKEGPRLHIPLPYFNLQGLVMEGRPQQRRRNNHRGGDFS